jgi:phospholipid/cholesterol/gamma-HCH transport system substrate-binding protein
MKPSRLEGKVGLFVFIGLILLAVLLLEFSKGLTFFRPTYDILLNASTVSGLKPRAQVLMSGVQVGTVSNIQLAPDGKSVNITLRIYRQYQIFKDARFVIEASGFLGDQYVAILPTKNEGPMFGPGGGAAKAEAPLDMQELARSAAGFIVHIDSAATNINNALSDARRTILSARALTNLSVTFDNFHRASERAQAIVDKVDALVESNRTSITVSVSNLLYFSGQINQAALAARELVATNSPEINNAVKNLDASTATLKQLLDGVQQGKGLAGNLLENEQIAANVSQIVDNLSITTSNLNRLGLWGILWQHKPPGTNEPPEVSRPLTSPKNPFAE